MKERTKLLLFLGVFAAAWHLPVDNAVFPGAVTEGFSLLRWYAREHVILCLVPALFIAGAIGVFVNQGLVMKYLGPAASRWIAYPVAAASGSILAVCSCTVLPLFAGIHKPWLAMAAVFLGGVLTASNPCVLAMIPLMMSFIAGRRDEKVGVLRSLGYSFVFVLGLAMTFTALGMTAALAGTIYGDISKVWNWIVAAVCIVMGLHLMEVLRFTIPSPVNLQPRTRGFLGALFLGLLFGLVSAPCAAPILVVLLTYLAGSGASVTYGGLLLLIYALGHSVLILIAGTSMGAARKIIESRRATNLLGWMRRIAGGVIVLVGLYFGYLAVVA